MGARSLSLLALVFCCSAFAQDDTFAVLLDTDGYAMGDPGPDPAPELERYRHYIKAMGGDSIRLCGNSPCSGQVVDHYPDGTPMHKGYYEYGRLLVFKNYHPDGTVERDFKALDAIKCVQRTWHPNGQLRSEARFADGVAYEYKDYYVDGVLRYAEQRHRKDPYFIRMDLFAGDGTPVSTLALVDKKRIEFEQKEYHPGGSLRSVGRARYDRVRMDTRRVGTWKYYAPDGTLVREEDHVDGRVATVR
jgi:antitoxin component YwqK of YwqJK toxin-antitoxin module